MSKHKSLAAVLLCLIALDSFYTYHLLKIPLLMVLPALSQFAYLSRVLKTFWGDQHAGTHRTSCMHWSLTTAWDFSKESIQLCLLQIIIYLAFCIFLFVFWGFFSPFLDSPTYLPWLSLRPPMDLWCSTKPSSWRHLPLLWCTRLGENFLTFMKSY